MTSTASASIFSAIAMAPRDPILGITEAFNADTNPAKINLGVGVYYDDNGKVPLLQCVRKAEALMVEQQAPRTYLPIAPWAGLYPILFLSTLIIGINLAADALAKTLGVDKAQKAPI